MSLLAAPVARRPKGMAPLPECNRDEAVFR